MDEHLKKPLKVYTPSVSLEDCEFDENGVNLTLIRENLRLSPEDRLRRGDRAREEALRQMTAEEQQ
jgi:hypothetical protein